MCLRIIVMQCKKEQLVMFSFQTTAIPSLFLISVRCLAKFPLCDTEPIVEIRLVSNHNEANAQSPIHFLAFEQVDLLEAVATNLHKRTD